jgi:hypothetical protein
VVDGVNHRLPPGGIHLLNRRLRRCTPFVPPSCSRPACARSGARTALPAEVRQPDRDGISGGVCRLASAACSFLACTIQPGSGPFAGPNPFLFGDSGKNRKNRLSEHAARVEVLLSMGSPVDPIRVQSLKIVEGFENALARETVEGPKQQDVELALSGVPPLFLEAISLTTSPRTLRQRVR